MSIEARDGMEEWRDLTFMGYDHYSVSTLGRVVNTETGKEVKSHLTQRGIVHTGLYSNGVRTNYSLAQIVAKAFLPPPREDYFNTLIHRDGNFRNNSYENLEWRPKWFTIKYHREYHDITFNPAVPVQEKTSGQYFRSAREAASYFGVLESDVNRMCETGRPASIEPELIFTYKE